MSYAGDVSPREAWEALRDDPNAVLVDVRTHAEWTYVGLPVLDEIDRTVVPIEWVRYPDGAPNQRFLESLREVVDEGQPIYYLCRSGVRSAAAAEAATAAGLGPAFNISDGFEGQHDAEGHRTRGGWKNSDLPWRQ
jgi:rhodanese-related sulfurtransferase